MFTNDVIQICNSFRCDDLHVAPGIPNEKLCALSMSTMLPPNTQVLALIDTTVFGSARNGMLITANGLYMHNDNSANTPGCIFISWQDLWMTNNSMYPFKVGLGELALTPIFQFEFSGCSLNADQVIPLLMNLRAAYGKYTTTQAQNVTQPSCVNTPQVKCQFCESLIDGNLKTCSSCGATITQQTTPSSNFTSPLPMLTQPIQNQGMAPQQAFQQSLFQPESKSRTVYILLAIFCGCLGIHNFYIGRTIEGIIQLLLTIITMGIGIIVTGPWALINIITVKTDSKGSPLT